MPASDSDELLTRIGEIKTRLTDQSTSGLVTRAYLDEKMKSLAGKPAGSGKEEKKEEKKPDTVDQVLDLLGLKGIVDAFKSTGAVAGLGAIVGVLGVKLISWDLAFTGVLGKMKLKLDVDTGVLPKISRIPETPAATADAGSQVAKLQKLNEAAEKLTTSLRELTTVMQSAENAAA